MSYLDDIDKFMQKDLQLLEVEGLPPFYCGPLTIKQASEIQAEQDDMLRIAKHFVIRAKDDKGKPLIKGVQFEQFVKKVPADVVSNAVIEMSKLDTSLEDAEKN